MQLCLIRIINLGRRDNVCCSLYISDKPIVIAWAELYCVVQLYFIMVLFLRFIVFIKNLFNIVLCKLYLATNSLYI